jgi:predicted nucleic acid-binding protein
MPERLCALDTSPWIALISKEPNRAEHVLRLLGEAERGDLRIFVSTTTITEIVKEPEAVAPVMSEVDERTFNEYMDNPWITMVSVDPIVATQARDLRRLIPRLKTPDAQILATALVARVEVLYTYDHKDLIPLNGTDAVGGMRIEEPPIEHQLALSEWSKETAMQLTADPMVRAPTEDPALTEES